MVTPRTTREKFRCYLLRVGILIILGSLKVNGEWYLGCFQENPQERTFNISAGNYRLSDISAQECTSTCSFLNQTYAAIEGELCFCRTGDFNRIAAASKDSLCDSACSDPLLCGNTSYIRVYNTQDAIGELRIHGPETGNGSLLLQDVSFTTSIGRGATNVSYTFDFGDGSYVLTTCPNATHMYTRVGVFHVTASARSNTSGPITASTWVSIESSTGLVRQDPPEGIVEAYNETKFGLAVSQGTNMKSRWVVSPGNAVNKQKTFDISDAIVHNIGSSATLGNTSASPEEGGAYVMPSAMIRKDGYILAWELFASKVGPVRLQIYRPQCSSANDHFCPRNYSCIPNTDACISTSLFTCPSSSICVGTGHCLANCQREKISLPESPSPLTDYMIVAESLFQILQVGKNIFVPKPEKAIQVQAGDVIGWAGNNSSGALAFEHTTNDTSFFYSDKTFSVQIGGVLSKSGGANRHEIKHVLRAYVSQPSQAAVSMNFTHAGLHKVTVVVENAYVSELKSCEVNVQERIKNLRISSPLSDVSYATGENVSLNASMDQGSDVSFSWTSNNQVVDSNNPVLVFNQTGWYPISVHARNNISTADDSTTVSILDPVSLKWLQEPQGMIDVGQASNFSFVLTSGTNVTVNVSFGDSSPVNETFYGTVQNTTVVFSHIYMKGGEKKITVIATNKIQTYPKRELIGVQRVKGKLGEIRVMLLPIATVSNILRISTNQEFEIAVSTSEPQPVNYTFKFSNDEPEVRRDNANSTKVTHVYRTDTDFNVTITASIVGYSEEKLVRIIATECGAPAILVPSSYKEGSPKIITKATPVDLRTSAKEQTNCPGGTLKYEWSIYKLTGGSKQLHSVSATSGLQSASFRLEPRTLNEGDFLITLNISYNDEKTPEENKYFYETYIDVVSSKLVAIIKGGSYREMDPLFNPETEKLSLDASGSYDPDGDTSLRFIWACKYENTSVDQSVSPPADELCNSTNFTKLDETQPSVSFNFSRFRHNVSYTFKVTVRQGSRPPVSAEQAVKIIPNVPSLEISCLDCQDKINPQERLTLRGECTNCGNMSLDDSVWKLLDENGNQDALSGNDSITTTGWQSINLVIKAHTLKEDKIYTAQLEGRLDVYVSKVEFRFITTSPPKPGECTVSPSSGVVAEEKFYMECLDWRTVDNPISYEFRYQITVDDLAEINTLPTTYKPSKQWYYGGDRSTPSSVLPLGDPQDDFKLQLFVRVYNKYLCFTDYHLQVRVSPVEIETEEKYNQLEGNITDEFNGLDAKTDPQKVIQIVNSVSSILNYDNKTAEGTQENREKIRSIMVNKLATIKPTDLHGVQQQTSATREAVQNRNEVTSKTQKTASSIFRKGSSFLKENIKNVGPVKVEEVSQSILTGVSDVLEASNVTTENFIQIALEKNVPTTELPSRAWSGRIRSRNSEEAARDSKEVLDMIQHTVNDVGDAIMSKKVFDEEATTIKTPTFGIKLERSRIDKLSSNMTVEKSTCDTGGEPTGQFVLPDTDVLLEAVKDDITRDQFIDSQVVSFCSNPFRSDEKSSQYIHSVTGFSLRTANKAAREIPINHLEKDVEVFIPTDLKSVSKRHSVNFEERTLQRHRYQLNVDSPIYPMIVHVKPDNDEKLLVYFRVGYDASPAMYDLQFPVPFEEETLSHPFRKIDNFTFMVLEEIWSESSQTVYFSLAIKAVSEKFEKDDELSRAVNVSYTEALFPVRCMYWSPEKLGEWQGNGCKVGNKTTFQMTHCLCNHLTFFGSLNIKPNPIGPPTLAKFEQGYALLVFVCLIFLFYSLGLVWARRKDRADVVRVGVTPLRDNDPSDPYRYELTLWTGMRRNAGTKSKISIIVYGDEQDSEPRVLEDPDRNPFQRGSLDTFLMTTPFNLGSMQYIRIWHDNTGGSWFLSRIMVIDLQTDERYYFICNRWLAVDEEDGQVERLVPLASKAELTEFGHLFVARTRRNLSDSHLWFSVLARPANSRFTRVQRLSCCLCLLLMSMMASGMYYNRQDDPSESQYVGSIVFTWSQVAIGIISSLIVFPVNLFLVQIFRNVRPRPKVKHKSTADPSKLPTLSFTKENLENYNQLKDSSDESNKGSSNSLDSSREKNNRTRLSINDVHTDVDRASFTDSPLLADRRLSTTYDIANYSRFRRAILFFKKKFTLPYYFVYVAWALVFIFSTGSAIVIVFYGMEFGNKKSLQWLFASCVSFVQDVLITQPLKVLGLAVFFALVVKKPDKGEFEITEEAIKLAEDEEFLQQSMAGQAGGKTTKTTLLPPDRARLIAMRNARMKERKMYSVIREIATFYVFLSLLLMITYTHRDPVAFFQTKNFVSMMAKNFSKISNDKEFWNWTRKELLDSLFPSKWYNGQARQPDGFMADANSQMVGGARLRLLRINKESCQVPTDVYGITNECYGEYFLTNDDENDYTVGWYNVTEYDNPITWDDMPWRYQNGTELDGYPFWATVSTYSGGGYVIVLEPGMDNLDRIKKLEESLWLERKTRAILTELTIYNAQTNLFCVVTLVAEFPATGGVLPRVSIQTARLYDFTAQSYMFFVVGCQVVFVLFVLFFAYGEAKKVYKNGIQAYFKEFWNYVEFGIIAFTLVAVGLYVYRALNIKDVVTEVQQHPFKFKSFQFAAYWDETYTFILAIIVLLANIKLNKLLRFNKRLSLLSSTLKYASFPLMMFSIVWGIVFIALTLVSSLVFGPSLVGYRSVIASFTSLFSLMLGRTAFVEMEATNRILGPLFFFVFTFLISMVLVNMFLSIVIDSFRVVKHDNDKQSNEYEIVDFIIERFKLWSGIGKTRRPHSRRRILWDTAMNRVKAVNALNNRHSITIAGLHLDNVSELENRLEKLIDRTDMLYEELFPEKKQKQRAVKGQVNLSFSKEDLLEGQVSK